MEDYLEAILALERLHKVARAKDIAERLKVKRGTVTGALKSLAEKGMINYTPYSYITLTPKGSEIASEIKPPAPGHPQFPDRGAENPP